LQLKTRWLFALQRVVCIRRFWIKKLLKGFEKLFLKALESFKKAFFESF